MTPSLNRGGSHDPRKVDGAKLARYRENPADPAAGVRFAYHVLSRYPGDVWALSALALHAPDNAAL